VKCTCIAINQAVASELGALLQRSESPLELIDVWDPAAGSGRGGGLIFGLGGGGGLPGAQAWHLNFGGHIVRGGARRGDAQGGAGGADLRRPVRGRRGLLGLEGGLELGALGQGRVVARLIVVVVVVGHVGGVRVAGEADGVRLCNLAQVGVDQLGGGALDAQALGDAVGDVGAGGGGGGVVLAHLVEQQGASQGQLLDVGARGGVDDAAHGLVEARVKGGAAGEQVVVLVVGRGRGRGGGVRVGQARGRDVAVEQLDAGQQQLAVELEDLVQLGGDVGADDVLDADAGRLELADGEQLSHVAALLLGDGGGLLLQHAQALDGHLKVHLELGLRAVSEEGGEAAICLL
jgi:hypothetical protein